MSTINKSQAVEILAEAVRSAAPEDLVEIYYELFPGMTAAEETETASSLNMAEKVLQHFSAGLEVEEILDLWNVVFPSHRNVWFDEFEEQLHYDEESTPVETLE